MNLLKGTFEFKRFIALAVITLSDFYSIYSIISMSVKQGFKERLKYIFQTTRSASPDGSVQGFCFSKIFGGTCSGIPQSCQPCLALCADRSGQQFSVDIDDANDENRIDLGKLFLKCYFNLTLNIFPHFFTFLHTSHTFQLVCNQQNNLKSLVPNNKLLYQLSQL